MIVYRAQTRDLYTADALAAIRRDLDEVASCPAPDLERVQDLLIRCGEFEAAMADSLNPERDVDSAEVRVLREMSVALGRLFCRVLDDASSDDLILRGSRALAGLAQLRLPDRVRVSAPEGYAYYALYPQTYAASAEQCRRELAPCDLVVIGIRGIGASLASVVAGYFEEQACSVRSYTVRPHGHPFDRVVRIGGDLRREWGAAQSALFCVVDEGPGLSGSSFTSVTALLEGIGIPDERIALFPSWNADPATFVNETARRQWPRYRKFVASAGAAPRPEGRNVSAGAWRPLLFAAEADYPAVEPQHERVKYLSDSSILQKFAGLGHYGRSKLPIAEQLAEGGFAPAPTGFGNGFLSQRFERGTPLFARDVSSSLLDCIASYAAFRRAKLPAQRSVEFDDMLQLVSVNSEEGLDGTPPSSVSALTAFRSEFDDRPATAVDGRMLPHEWLRGAGGFIKADATDHHADHFFPGGADIVWDLAAAGVEFELDGEERAYLLRRYVERSGDHPSRGLVSFYGIAYLAFRLGYCSLAAARTAGTSEQERFTSLKAGYGWLLVRELSAYGRNVQVTA